MLRLWRRMILMLDLQTETRLKIYLVFRLHCVRAQFRDQRNRGKKALDQKRLIIGDLIRDKILVAPNALLQN